MSEFLSNELDAKQYIEGKSVGIIYHFFRCPTHDVGQITKDILLYGLKSKKDYISFTRHFDLPVFGDFRLCVNGNRLSDKYKIDPFYDPEMDVDVRRDKYSEFEERIVWPRLKPLPIIKYLLCVDINIRNSFNRRFLPDLLKQRRKINHLFPEFPVRFVNGFKPYHKQKCVDLPYNDKERYA